MSQTEGNTAIAPEVVTVPVKKAASKKKIWIIAASALAAVVIITVSILLLLPKGGSGGKVTYNDIQFPKSYIQLTYDNSASGSYLTGGSDSNDKVGTFKVDAWGKGALYSSGSTVGMDIILSGDYLIYKDFILEGNVPATGNLEGIYWYAIGDGVKNTYTFSRDGKVSIKVKISDSTYDYQGNYVRSGDKVTITLGSGSVYDVMVVYNGRLAVHAYEK